MVVKKIRINGRLCSIAGVSLEDSYFSAIGDECDPEFIDFCHRYIHDDYFCFDIGANIGVKTLALSDFASSGRVAAFEPGPTIYSLLCQNLAQNNIANADSMNVAVGAEDGIVMFEENSAYGHITESPGGIQIASRSLNSALEELKYPRLDFVKIDVEGFEFAILRSSIEVLRKHRSLVYFEFNCFAQIAFDQPSPKQFLEWIFANFPFVYLVNRNSDAPELLTRVGAGDVLHLVHQNMLAHGCVTDFVATFDEKRLSGTDRPMASGSEASPVASDPSCFPPDRVRVSPKQKIASLKKQRNTLRKKIAVLKTQRDKLRSSKNNSWRRRIRKLLGRSKS